MEIIRGVALIVADPHGRILLLREFESKPQFGKAAGMRSIPMETAGPGELNVTTLRRLVTEELPGFPPHIADSAQAWGKYRIVDDVWVELFVTQLGTEHEYAGKAAREGDEVGDHAWFTPTAAQEEWLRRGAREMIADYTRRFRYTVRYVCVVPRMILRENPANATG